MKLTRLSSWLLWISAFPFAAYADAGRAQPFSRITPETQALNALCASLAPRCQADNVQLWQPKNRPNAPLYLIDDAIPRLLALKQQDGGYRVITAWDFSRYPHAAGYDANEDPDQAMTPDALSIYPALYPLSKSRFAAALINGRFAGYSGGGAGEQTADFVQLNDDGSYLPALTNIPFSSFSRIRACFTKEEYRRSPHCHDEEWMTLQIQFRDVGKPYYLWLLTQKSYSWPQAQPRSAIKVEVRHYTLMPFAQ